MTPPQTPRLRLRPYTPADQGAVLELFADPYAREFYPHMSDTVSARKWIEWNIRNYAEFGFGLWAVERNDTGQFLGDCGLTYQQIEGLDELEIGYHILASERRNGYATEAARACLEFGFRRTAAAMICSIVRPSNAASSAVAARVHTARRDCIYRGAPALLFYTLRAEFAGRTARTDCSG